MFPVVQGLKTMQLYVGSRKGDPPASQVKTHQQVTGYSPSLTITGLISEAAARNMVPQLQYACMMCCHDHVTDKDTAPKLLQSTKCFYTNLMSTAGLLSQQASASLLGWSTLYPSPFLEACTVGWHAICVSCDVQLPKPEPMQHPPLPVDPSVTLEVGGGEVSCNSQSFIC